MYNFVWDFNKENFEKCKTEKIGDYVGNIRVGNICFDIIQIVDEDVTLWIDCYVGGVDTGYGYSLNKDNYPYDYAYEVGTSMNIDEYEKLSYEQFVNIIEKELTDSINDKKTYTADNGILVNLIDKANEPLNIW